MSEAGVMKKRYERLMLLWLLILAFTGTGCRRSTRVYRPSATTAEGTGTLTGLDVLARSSFELLRGKTIGLIVNAASVDRQGRHALDLLKDQEDIRVGALFAPEHGFFTRAAAGEPVKDGTQAGIPVISLYGEKKKPIPGDLEGLDLLVFDLPDAGSRYYTYAGTLTLALQAAAERGLPFVLLDRPNPLNGRDLEGPVLKEGFRSFVGMHPIPIRHGLTLGELAFMINESGWLGGDLEADLTIVPLLRWNREMAYTGTGLPWIPPSPNLPDFEAALAYPGTCLLEATNVSEGRGTERPFLLVGAPWVDAPELAERMDAFNGLGFSFESASFTPISTPGADHPKYENRRCHGLRIRPDREGPHRPVRMGVRLLETLHRLHPDRFRIESPRHLDRLYGSNRLRRVIEEGEDAQELMDDWSAGLDKFEEIRKGFLIY